MRSAENKSLNVFNSIAFLSKIWNTSQFAYSLEGSDLCGQENTAVYGPCIATSCQDVQLQLLISETSPAYPGLPFSLIVLKMDAYNQTISSDSMTLLQVQVAHSRTRQQDVTIQVLGSSTFKLQGGSADISISVVPRFASVIPSLGVALLFQNVYIWVSGIDSETLNPIFSVPTLVTLSSGFRVCPSGYVLDLALSKQDIVTGSCLYCQIGTYSLNPLFSEGYNYSKPACLACPAGGICNGGDHVEFQVGKWVPNGGMYVLESCPPGYQLVNQQANLFSQSAQTCFPCSPTEYIVNPNSPHSLCEPCPSGALCNGSSLTGITPGSLWVPNYHLGIYLLESCPTGYEILNTDISGVFSAVDQECNYCPASFYCIGGNATRRQCPPNSYSVPGSNSSRSCASAVFVALAVTLPLTPAEFEADTELRFRVAVAAASGVSVGYVVVDTVSQARRSSGSGVLISSRIASESQASVSLITSLLTTNSLNRELAAQGLPDSTSLSVTVQTISGEGAQVSTAIVVGLSLGGSILLLGFLWAVCVLSTRKSPTQEEQMLNNKMAELRKIFKISRDDGFLLNSEKPPWLRRQREGYTVLRKDYLEAAARLALFMDFDVAKFDALCVCLEYSGLNDAHPTSTSKTFSREPPGPSTCLAAIHLWLLEISKKLIEPILPQIGPAFGEPLKVVPIPLRPEERFLYLKNRVCRARIWSEYGGALFERLKAAALEYMEDIARLCNERFDALRMEPKGEQLIAFQVGQEKLAAGYIRRQDHSEVRFELTVPVHDYDTNTASHRPRP